MKEQGVGEAPTAMKMDKKYKDLKKEKLTNFMPFTELNEDLEKKVKRYKETSALEKDREIRKIYIEEMKTFKYLEEKQIFD